MPKTSKTLSAHFKLVKHPSHDFPNMNDPNVNPAPTLLKYQDHLQSIQEDIQSRNADALLQKLTMDMQCSRVSVTHRRYWEKPENYAPHYVSDAYNLNTRPFIEWLFFEDRDRFYDLIQFILKQRCDSTIRENLCKILVNSLKETDLENPQLWNLNLPAQKCIRLQIERLECHSKLLSLKEDPQAKDRSAVIQNLISDLSNKLNSFLKKPSPSKAEEIPFEKFPDNHTKKLCILNFKLEFIKILHSKDKRNEANSTLGLTEHRDGGLAILMSNLASLLFTGGIANLLLGMSTNDRRWFFYQQTETQEILEDLESNLGLRA